MDKAIFEAIDSPSVVDGVVNQIEKLIIAGVLKGGRKLPSERELAEQMGISRPKIRDAIKDLEARGLLEVKHGDGTFVAALTGTALSPAMIELFSKHPEAFGGYIEFRREVEGFAAYVAAIRATEADREIIARIMTEMEAAHEARDRERELKLDVGLHAAIVDAAHNPLLVHVMASIYELMERAILQGRMIQEGPEASRAILLQQHRAIADAILERDPEAASAAAEEHINSVEASYRERSSESSRANIARKRRMLLETPTPNATAGRRGRRSVGLA